MLKLVSIPACVALNPVFFILVGSATYIHTVCWRTLLSFGKAVSFAVGTLHKHVLESHYLLRIVLWFLNTNSAKADSKELSQMCFVILSF